MKKFLFITAILISYAQNLFAADIGIINSSNSYKLDVYDKISGTKIGIIQSEGFEKKYIDSAGNNISLKNNDVAYSGYEEIAITYYEDKNGYINVLRDALKDKGAWIKRSDLEKQNITTILWIDFLVDKNPPWQNYSQTKLYSEASNKSKILLSLNDISDKIEVTGNKKDQWAEVIITRYNGSRFYWIDNVPEPAKLLVIKGWMKFVNENGSPAIYYNMKGGC